MEGSPFQPSPRLLQNALHHLTSADFLVVVVAGGGWGWRDGGVAVFALDFFYKSP